MLPHFPDLQYSRACTRLFLTKHSSIIGTFSDYEPPNIDSITFRYQPFSVYQIFAAFRSVLPRLGPFCVFKGNKEMSRRTMFTYRDRHRVRSVRLPRPRSECSKSINIPKSIELNTKKKSIVQTMHCCGTTSNYLLYTQCSRSTSYRCCYHI